MFKITWWNRRGFNFIKTVYELFDNPSYFSSLSKYFVPRKSGKVIWTLLIFLYSCLSYVVSNHQYCHWSWRSVHHCDKMTPSQESCLTHFKHFILLNDYLIFMSYHQYFNHTFPINFEIKIYKNDRTAKCKLVLQNIYLKSHQWSKVRRCFFWLWLALGKIKF